MDRVGLEGVWESLLPQKSFFLSYLFVRLQLYLEVLPEGKEQWISRTKEFRAQYEKIKEMVRVPSPRLCPFSSAFVGKLSIKLMLV